MRPHRRPRAPARGFSLIELMVVVVIIAVLATIAVPLFAQRMRQRAVQQMAQSMAETFRGARTRALGRGAAIMVSVRPNGAFTVLEGVRGTAQALDAGVSECGNLPTRGCSSNDWGNLGGSGVIGTARVIGDTPANTSDYSTVVALGGTSKTNLNVCFSPGGRAFVNEATAWPAAFTPLTDVVTVNITRDGRTYTVVVLPNGTARLGL